MNYTNLFNNTDRLDGGGNFRCLYYRHSGPKSLECECRYPVLFVLQGTCEMRLGYSTCTVEAGNFIVIDAQKLSVYHPAEQTIVLIYLPPKQLSYFFGQCSRSFCSDYSESVPILPPLQGWIDSLLERCTQQVRWTSEDEHGQRRELATILMNSYPRQVLNELYAPFLVCTMSDCERCQETAID